MDYTKAFISTGEAVRCNSLSSEGYVLSASPQAFKTAAQLVTRPAEIPPAHIADIPVPALKDFSIGPDFFWQRLGD